MTKFTNVLFFCLLVQSVFAQSAWTPVSEISLDQQRLNERSIIPDEYDVYQLNLNAFKKAIKDAPLDDRKSILEEGVIIEFPMPGGEVEKFKAVYAPVMHPELAAKYPSIRSFRAVGVDKPYLIGRFNYGPQGLRAAIKTPETQIYIDNYSDNDDEYYITYDVRDHHEELPEGTAFCGGHEDPQDIYDMYLGDTHIESRTAGEEVFLRKYRLAMACTGEWGQIKGSKEAAIEGIVQGANRVNLTLEVEAAITFELIPNNDDIVFIDPNTDPYFDAHLGREILQQNTGVLNAFVGINSYDVGHVFNRVCTDGIAGVASLASICGNSKGAGVSCVGGANITNFMVQVTIHEVGHQFGASHTWSLCSEGSADQLATSTAYEPCSGTTFMSYAGVCASVNNIKASNDDYYHVASLEQMYVFSQVGSGDPCAEKIATGNHVPDVFVDYEDGFTIPSSTPFELTGRAIDQDGDPVLYCWEQHDNGGLLECGNPIGNSPAFRSYPPTTEETRYFPALSKILNNTNDKSEVLIDYTRSLEFYCTVRDISPAGASLAAWDAVSFNVTIDAGPFFITNLNDINTFMEVGSLQNLTWDVANTDLAPVNCERVNVYLSTDGGNTFPYTLLKNTINDGEESFVVPNVTGTDCRIKVMAANSIFFDINNAPFSIVEPSEPDFYFSVSSQCYEVCLPDVIEIDIESAAFLDYATDISFSVDHDLPEGTVVSVDQDIIAPNDPNKITVDLTNVNASGSYTLDITGSSADADDITYTIFFDILGTDFSDLAIEAPASGSFGVSEVPTFSWSKAQNAEFYTFELGRNPKLGDEAEFRFETLTDTFLIAPELLEKSSLYYWRVYVENQCADGATALSTFATEALSCQSLVAEDLPINISQSGTPSVESFSFVSGAGNVSDVNVSQVKGNHSNAGDLRMTLISPSGTEVELVRNKCNFTSNFNCGFDDQAPTEIECPLSSGSTFIPRGSLADFNGEPIEGDWTLRIDDTSSGNGGTFTDFVVEICSNATLDNPFLVNNVPLGIPLGMSNALQDTSLLAEDNNNTAAELIYTLITLPANGTLSMDGENLDIGSQFSQKDINDVKVKYQHDNTDELTDSFDFTVIDGEGGYIDVTTFNLFMGEGLPTIVDELDALFSVNIYPNPTDNMLYLDINGSEEANYAYKIFDINGKLIQAKHLGQATSIIEDVSVREMENGIYFLQVMNGKSTSYKKFSVQR